jgi:hypothetical protein
MLPVCGATMPQIWLRKVDLPPPDGPIRRMRFPAGKAKLSTAIEKVLRPGQAKLTPDMAMMSGVSARGLAVAATITRVLIAKLVNIRGQLGTNFAI